MQATLNGDGIIIEAEHGGGPRVTITFTDGVTINEALCADFAVRLLSGIGPRGPRGLTGNGIASVTLNQDYTLTLTFTDGTTFTTPVSLRGAPGETGPTGATFTPSVDSSGNISWTNDGGKTNPQTVNIKGPQGETGTTFTPSVDSSGNISWTNDGGKTNPQTANIKGPQGDTYVLTSQDKQDIAALVEAMITHDTDWVPLASYLTTANLTEHSSNKLYARRIGDIVYVKGEVSLVSALSSGGDLGIFTGLPSDFCPEDGDQILRVAIAGNNGPYRFSVSSEGWAAIKNLTGAQRSAGNSLKIDCCYMVGGTLPSSGS